MVCASQLVYAAVEVVIVAVVVTLVGGAAMVAAEVVAETALSRIVSIDVLGRVMRVCDAVSLTAMIAGAVLAPIVITGTTLTTSFLALGSLSLIVTLVCSARLRGLDVLSERRAEALSARVAAIEDLSITVGVPRLVVEQLASAAQICPLPDGVDVVVEGAPAYAFYVVVDGRVVVHRQGEVVVRLGAGSWFGERGLLDNAPRSATVTTEVDSTILRIDGAVLLDALQSSATLVSTLDRSNAPRPRPPTSSDVPFVDDISWAGP